MPEAMLLRGFTAHVAKIRGARTRYFVGGAGEPLILVHGLGGAAVNFAELAPLLARGNKVLIPDLPGHAGSGPLAEVEGLTLRGYVDRLDVAADGAMRVVDYKTGRSPSELFEAKALFQMKFYALVLWRIHGEIPRQLQLVYLGNAEVVRYSPDERDLLAIERNIRAIWDAVVRAAQTGDWRPRTSRLCDWCDFRDLCPAWGGTPPPLPEGAGLIALDPARSGAAVPADD